MKYKVIPQPEEHETFLTLDISEVKTFSSFIIEELYKFINAKLYWYYKVDNLLDRQVLSRIVNDHTCYMINHESDRIFVDRTPSSIILEIIKQSITFK